MGRLRNWPIFCRRPFLLASGLILVRLGSPHTASPTSMAVDLLPPGLPKALSVALGRPVLVISGAANATAVRTSSSGRFWPVTSLRASNQGSILPTGSYSFCVSASPVPHGCVLPSVPNSLDAYAKPVIRLTPSLTSTFHPNGTTLRDA